MSRSFRIIRNDSYYRDLEGSIEVNDLHITPLRGIVQKALFSEYQNEKDFESDVLKIVDSPDGIQTCPPRPLVEPTIGLDLTIPLNTPLLPIDPFEEINMDNWKQRGALREYYVTISQGNLESTGRSFSSATPDPDSLADNLTTAAAGSPESVPRKRKRSESSVDDSAHEHGQRQG